MRGLQSIYLFFHNDINKFNTTRARMLDYLIKPQGGLAISDNKFDSCFSYISPFKHVTRGTGPFLATGA